MQPIQAWMILRQRLKTVKINKINAIKRAMVDFIDHCSLILHVFCFNAPLFLDKMVNNSGNNDSDNACNRKFNCQSKCQHHNTDIQFERAG